MQAQLAAELQGALAEALPHAVGGVEEVVAIGFGGGFLLLEQSELLGFTPLFDS